MYKYVCIYKEFSSRKKEKNLAAAHRVAVAVGAIACPFGPSWRCQAGAAADHPEPGRSEVALFFLAGWHQAQSRAECSGESAAT